MRSPFSRRPRLPFEREPQSEVNDELAFHLEQRVRDYVARGMSPEAARAAALERFGDVAGVRSECTELLEEERRVAGRRDWLEALRQDVRYGVRAALRAPLFTLSAVVTLALGIGANAAVFGVVKSALLDALPYREADRLVRVYGRMLDGTMEKSAVSVGTLNDLRERQRSFTAIAGFNNQVTDAVLGDGDGPQVISRAWVEPGLFSVLGVPMAMGRNFRAEDAQHDTVYSIIISHGAWQRLYGGDPAIVGKTTRVNNITRTIVGVLPQRFVGPMGEADVFFTLNLRPWLNDPIGLRRSHWLGVVGRLKPGATPERARDDVTAIGADLSREYPADNGPIGMTAMPLRDAFVGDTRTPLLVLLASAGLVLLITCANLAGALLSRTLTRRKEFAVRIALGAGRGRLVRQLLTESMLLAITGGALGLLLAAAALGALRKLALTALPPYVDLSLDPGAIAITAAVALVTGLAFGLAPALAVGRTTPQGTLREESRGASEGRRTQRLRGALVAGQLALCGSLLVGAALLARSLWAIASAPLGFTPDQMLTAAVQIPGDRYDSVGTRIRMYDQVLERVKAVPGVRGAVITSAVPTRVQSANGLTIEGREWSGDNTMPFIPYQTISDEYFRMMGIPLKQGRVFGPQDHFEAPGAIVINETMARKFWPRGDAVGAHIRLGPNLEGRWATIVGVVADVRAKADDPRPEPHAYATIRQNPNYPMMLAVRTTGDPLRYVRPVQQALWAVDRNLPLHRAEAMESLLADGMAPRRLPAVLMTAFGALALLLASVGVYAMFASMAAAREREFGVRVALGSTPRRIATLVLRQGALWMALGLAGGVVGVMLVARLLRQLLYGVEPFDPMALGAAVLLLLLCALVALLGPVRRATRVDPITVLR